tara:strand:- start:914 stop:1219 length:306 start_codon:yes stop_codon:yes gene_type:complete
MSKFTEQQLYNCMVDSVLVIVIKQYAGLVNDEMDEKIASSENWNKMIEGVIKDEFNKNAEDFWDFCMSMAKSQKMRHQYLKQKDSQEFRLPELFELLKKLD